MVLALATLVHVVSSFSVLSVQTLAPFIKADLGLTHAQVGMLTSLFYAGNVFLSASAGWLVDRLGVYRVLLAGQLVIGVFVALLYETSSFIGAAILLLLAGLGYAGVNPATGKAVVDRFPPRGRALAMGIKQNGVPLGGALAAVLLPGLAVALGWRAAVLVAGGLCALSALAVALFYGRNGQGDAAEGSSSFGCSPRSRVGEVLRNRNLMILSLALLFYMAFQISFMTYFTLYARDILALSILAAGAFFSLWNVSGILGRLFWGFASDYLLSGRRRGILSAIGLIAAGTSLAIAFLSPGSSLWLIGGVMVLMGFSAMGWPGIFLTLVAELAEPAQVGSAFGLCVGIVSVGVIFGPPLFGVIVDRTGSYSSAWMIFSALLLGAALLVRLVRDPVGRLSKEDAAVQDRRGDSPEPRS